MGELCYILSAPTLVAMQTVLFWLTCTGFYIMRQQQHRRCNKTSKAAWTMRVCDNALDKALRPCQHWSTVVSQEQKYRRPSNATLVWAQRRIQSNVRWKLSFLFSNVHFADMKILRKLCGHGKCTARCKAFSHTHAKSPRRCTSPIDCVLHTLPSIANLSSLQWDKMERVKCIWWLANVQSISSYRYLKNENSAALLSLSDKYVTRDVCSSALAKGYAMWEKHYYNDWTAAEGSWMLWYMPYMTNNSENATA